MLPRPLLPVGCNFYPRPPRGGRHELISKASKTFEISIHALREEGDMSLSPKRPKPSRFLSTPSARRATCLTNGVQFIRRFLSTPSARRATPSRTSVRRWLWISIHALREEGDVKTLCLRLRLSISIHALREEGDAKCSPFIFMRSDFYPRPPRGGRLLSICREFGVREISIHALREEGDSKNRDKISIFKQIIQHSARI